MGFSKHTGFGTFLTHPLPIAHDMTSLLQCDKYDVYGNFHTQTDQTHFKCTSYNAQLHIIINIILTRVDSNQLVHREVQYLFLADYFTHVVTLLRNYTLFILPFNSVF